MYQWIYFITEVTHINMDKVAVNMRDMLLVVCLQMVKVSVNERQHISIEACPSAVIDIQTYVEQFVVGNQRPEPLTSVYARYLDICGIYSETVMPKASSAHS